MLSMLSTFLNWRFPEITITIELPFNQPKHFEQYFAYIKHPVTFSKPLFLISLDSDSLNIEQASACNLMRHQAMQSLQGYCKQSCLLSQLAKVIKNDPTTT